MTSAYKIRIAASLREIDAAQWDRCANPDAHRRDKDLRVEVGSPIAGGPATCQAPGNPADATPEHQRERFNPSLPTRS
jgi:hypothetical protein